MAIAHVQTAAVVVGDGTASSFQRAYASNVTGGNVLVVCSTTAGSLSVTGVTDTLSNTWAQVATGFSSGGVINQIWWASSPSGGACTVTVTCGGNAECTFTVSEFSGVAAASPVDTSGGASGSVGDATVNLTTTNADDLLLGACSHTSAQFSMTSGSGFTILAESELVVHMPLHSEHRVVSSTSTWAVPVTMGGTVNWKIFAAALKASSGSTTSRTQTGKSRVTATTTQTQTGKARITAHTSQTQSGVARMTPSVSKTITGKSKITATTTKTQLGLASISQGAPVYPHVQSSTPISVQASVSTTRVLTNVAAGNLIVVTIILALEPNGTSVASVTDSLGNAYTAAGSGRLWGSTNQYKNEIWFAQGIAAPATNTCTITVTAAASADITVIASEFTAIAFTNALDVFGGGFQTSGTNSSFTLTTAYPTDLIVATMSQSQGGTSLTSGSGFTMLGELESPAGMPIHSEYATVSSAGDYSVLVTLGASRNSAIFAAAFKRLNFVQTAQAQLGVSRLKNTASKTQTGVSTIGTHTSQTQSGKSRIAGTTTRTQGGTANITLNTNYPHVQTAPVLVRDASSSFGQAFGAPVGTGNMIVACIVSDGNASAMTVVSVVDSLGNTYQSVGATLSYGAASRYSVEIWYAMNVTGGSCTVTTTMSHGGDWSMTISEFSNMALTAALDVAGSATGTGTSASRTITTTNANDVLIGTMTQDADNMTLTSGSGYTLLTESEEAHFDMPIHSEFQAVSTAGAKTLDVTLGASATWGFYAAAFKRLGTVQTSKSLTGTARVLIRTIKTQSGKAALLTRTTQVQTGRAFLTGGVTQTSQAQPGRTTIVGTVNYIIVDGIMQPVGIVTQSQLQAGLSRITAHTSKAQSGLASIATAGQTFKNQLGKARVTATNPVGITGIARLERLVSVVQAGLARILAQPLRVQTGRARITATSTRAQQGTARMTVQLQQSRTQAGKAFIFVPLPTAPKSQATSTVFASTRESARVPF